MNPGDVVLIPITQTSGRAKLRPAVVLALLPGPYQSLLICGISTQIQALEPNWDDAIGPSDADFTRSGLHQASAVRLSFVRAAAPADISRRIGQIDDARLARLRLRLSDHLRLALSPGPPSP
jgi:mRNA-degrading endonuclease toxin of MazEF toxin-antitoxin module